MLANYKDLSKHEKGLSDLDHSKIHRQFITKGSREIVFTNFSCTPYKVLLSINNILCAHRFFLLYFFVSFSLYTFLWACMSLCDSLFVHLFACQITHSFLNEFQPSLYQHFSHVCSTCHTIYFQPEVNT